MKEKQLKNEELEQVTGGAIPIVTKPLPTPEVGDLDIGGEQTPNHNNDDSVSQGMRIRP